MTHTLPEPSKDVRTKSYVEAMRFHAKLCRKGAGIAEAINLEAWADHMEVLQRTQADTAAPVGMKTAEEWATEWLRPEGLLRDCRIAFIKRVQQDALRSVAAPVDVTKMKNFIEVCREHFELGAKYGHSSENKSTNGMWVKKCDDVLRSIATGQTVENRMGRGACAQELEPYTISQAADEIERLRNVIHDMTMARQTVPEGWQLVPKEPTEEMSLAGKHYMKGSADVLFERQKAIGCFNVMLAAAPPSPQGEGK